MIFERAAIPVSISISIFIYSRYTIRMLSTPGWLYFLDQANPPSYPLQGASFAIQADSRSIRRLPVL